MSRNNIPPLVADELESCGKPWRTENGGRHTKLFVNDRFVGILSRSLADTSWAGKRRVLNIRAQIRRAVREPS